jgi:hypothetical protein
MLSEMLNDRAADVRASGGMLGGWCGALERSRDELHRAEGASAALLRRASSGALRLLFEFLILVVVGLFELDTVRRHAASALAPPRRRHDR